MFPIGRGRASPEYLSAKIKGGVEVLMSVINLQNIRQAEGLMDELNEVRLKIERRVNIEKYSSTQKPVVLNGNKIIRICLLAGLTNKEPRDYPPSCPYESFLKLIPPDQLRIFPYHKFLKYYSPFTNKSKSFQLPFVIISELSDSIGIHSSNKVLERPE